MTSSAATSGPARAEAGFSIVELMTVLFIIAAVTSMVILTLPPRQPQGEVEGERLVMAIERASEQALVSGIAHGIRTRPDGYEIVRRVNGAWTPIAGSQHRFERGVRLAAAVDGEAPPEGPTLVFDPLGMAAGGPLNLVDGDRGWTLELSPGAVPVLAGGSDARR